MSQPVELSALRERIVEYGSNAFLVTVAAEGTPHVVSVVVEVQGDRLVMGAGRRTRANLEVAPTLTLLWSPIPTGTDTDYSLIVDGRYDASIAGDDAIAIVPTSAILHRIAGAPGDGPTCLPLA